MTDLRRAEEAVIAAAKNITGATMERTGMRYCVPDWLLEPMFSAVARLTALRASQECRRTNGYCETHLQPEKLCASASQEEKPPLVCRVCGKKAKHIVLELGAKMLGKTEGLYCDDHISAPTSPVEEARCEHGAILRADGSLECPYCHQTASAGKEKP